MRNNGILLHISSMPTDFGIGDFGPVAYKFATNIKASGHTLWQILPINHCGYGNSPYNPISAYALNPYLISPELLYQEHLIDAADLHEAKITVSDSVQYELVEKVKDKLLHKAVDTWLKHNDIYNYIDNMAPCLKPYLAFLALCKIYGDSAWYNWREEHRTYSEELYHSLQKSFAPYIHFRAACQAIITKQIRLFRKHLNDLGITLVGDMPLYLSYESAEVWANPHLFDLDQKGRRLHLAGVPPDAFSTEGQLWGNPIYNWEAMHADNYTLFTNRISQALSYLDVLRLDHFIGYVNYWQVDCDYDTQGNPISPKNALNGRWVDAKPYEFFTHLLSLFPKDRFLAEDLGILNEKVCHFRDSFGFPGMIILQFCFEESVPNIKNFPSDRWLYTGTHDNQTLQGWFKTLSQDSPSSRNLALYCKQNHPAECLGTPSANNIHNIMRNIALSSPCEKVVIPFQDILGLDDSARMNIPGTALGNWQWKLKKL